MRKSVRRSALALLALALAVGAAGCGGGGEQVPPKPAGLFDYDRAKALDFRDGGVINRQGAATTVAIHDVSYASPAGGRVHAFLLLPKGTGKHAAVIYLHGSGQDPSDFLYTAALLAQRGAVGLIVDTPFDRPQLGGADGAVARLERDRELIVSTIVELRRAVDVLVSRPEVDPRRIGFMGLSSGGKLGAILAGVEQRIKAYNLMSAGSPTPEQFASYAPVAIQPDIVRILRDTDPRVYVRRAAPSTLFFQNGAADRLVPHDQLQALVSAASSPKRVRWYVAGHELNPQACRDQIAWFEDVLALTKRPIGRACR